MAKGKKSKDVKLLPPPKTVISRRFYIYILLLLIFSAAVLLGLPESVKIAESRIIFSENLPEDNSSEVAEIKQPRIEIVDSNLERPKFSSRAVLALDLETGKILYEKNIHERLSPASTTKVMTALVAESHYKSADILEVSSQDKVGGSSMGLNVGEKLTYRSLLYGMLLNSGNDAAFTIASNYPGGMEKFVGKMNETAGALGLTNTHFTNPAGFDGSDHYSSAFDLAAIAKTAAIDPELSRVFSTKETSVLSYDSSKTHLLKNLNILLSEEGVLGIKTGFTQKSGENFVGLVERNNHKVLTVVLSSNDRFGETKELIDWVYKNYQWKLVN